jgi:hypothetical protein
MVQVLLISPAGIADGANLRKSDLPNIFCASTLERQASTQAEASVEHLTAGEAAP